MDIEHFEAMLALCPDDIVAEFFYAAHAEHERRNKNGAVFNKVIWSGALAQSFKGASSIEKEWLKTYTVK